MLATTLQTTSPSRQVRELAATVPRATTDETLHRLLANLTSVLGAQRAYVTEAYGSGMSRIIAAWEDGKRGSQRVYELAGTPCADVMRHGVQVVECDLEGRFDLADTSLGHGCESFVGSPIVDHQGVRIGQLCTFGAKPLVDAEMAAALVSLAATRVSAELEYRRQEKELVEQRRKLEVFLGNLPGMAYRCDAGGRRRLELVSSGCRSLTGYCRKELVDEVKYWDALIDEEDRQRVRNNVQSALAEDRNFETQYRIRTRDGDTKWVLERGRAIKGKSGRIEYVEGFVSDATALKQSQTALARSEAYASAIVAAAAEGIITLDTEARIDSANAAAERIFGYKADELIGKDVQVLVPEPYRSEHAGFISAYLETGESSILGKGREVLAQRKDGSVVPIYLAASKISVDGETRFTAIIRDVSERKAAEESLKAVERRFRAVFDQRQSLVGILDTDGLVLEANMKSLEFAGVARDEVVGRPFWDGPWWRHSQSLRQRMRDAIVSAAVGTTERFEVSCPRADGELTILDFAVRPITDADGEIVFLVTEGRDITQQRHAEHEARDHREQIAHVSRLSALGEMAAGIAHEINQPLTAISLFSQAGARLVKAGDFERMGEVCEKLNQHALRASAVIDRMQAMARLGERTKERVILYELIATAVKLAEAEARLHDFRIEVDRCVNCKPVLADGVQIQQVALNLIRNGIEAMLGQDQEQDRVIHVRTRCLDNDRVEASVTDTGTGISDEWADRLFTPFATTKESGMGMGLSISQAIIRAHGGEIGFRNNEEGGATFWFTLPTVKQEYRHGE